MDRLQGVGQEELLPVIESVIQTKQRVKEHWESEVCGSRYGAEAASDRRKFFEQIDRTRYELEPQLEEFAEFEKARGKRVLEVGLGTGADFSRWVRAGAIASGRDLTEASVNLVRERLELSCLEANVAVGDAEDLREFPDNSFDIFYSWGVLHHTPDPERAFAEAFRVLKPGGQLKVMLYHYPSAGALLVWLVHGPLRLRWQGPRQSVAEHYESPGTKMYTTGEARALVGKFFHKHAIEIRLYLGAGDLLTHRFSARYAGRKWELARALYPRWFVKHVLGARAGTGMMISTIK
ncbi:MAG: class I SAM-dependent methyltransferase [Candidatus Acidiferrales bacterium]